MIGGVEEPALHERLRAVTLWPFTAWVLTQLYFTSIPLLPGVPRWLFEVVRVLLVAGAVGGVGGAAFVLLQHRARVGPTPPSGSSPSPPGSSSAPGPSRA